MKNQIKKIKEELKKEDEEFYGDTSISGEMPDPESDDDTEKNIANALGNQPKQPFDLGDEVAKDEEDQR